jgi:hypothetical protein
LLKASFNGSFKWVDGQNKLQLLSDEWKPAEQKMADILIEMPYHGNYTIRTNTTWSTLFWHIYLYYEKIYLYFKNMIEN